MSSCSSMTISPPGSASTCSLALLKEFLNSLVWEDEVRQNGVLESLRFIRTAWSSACLACGVAVPSGFCVSFRTVTSFSSKPSYNVVQGSDAMTAAVPT